MSQKPPAANRLPDVGRIQGLTLRKSTTAALSAIELQYTDLQGQWHQVRMPLLDAAYLTNLLERTLQDAGFDHLRRPKPP